MKKVIEFFNGKKTYIIATVMALLNIAVALGYINPEHLTQINLVLVALGFSAIRSGINSK